MIQMAAQIQIMIDKAKSFEADGHTEKLQVLQREADEALCFRATVMLAAYPKFEASSKVRMGQIEGFVRDAK